MKIDIHSHLLPRSYRDAVEADGSAYGAYLEVNPETQREEIVIPPGGRYILVDQVIDPAAKIAELDRFGFDMAVVSAPAYAVHHELTGSAAAAHTRMLNDGMAAIQREHRSRLRGMAMLPLQEPELAVAEVDRAIDELGLSAGYILANIDGKNLDEPAYRPVFKRLEERGMFLFIHALLTSGRERIERYRLFNAIGNPLDDTIAIYSLIYGGILEEFPGLKICVAHGGGQASYIAGRIDRGWRIHESVRKAIPRAPSTYLRSLYYDTITHDPLALQYLADKVGTSQLMVGSDCPYHLFDMGDPDPIGTVDALHASDEERELILGGTAAKLIKIASESPSSNR
jgi:aminocarboxymuconate-semialdehyde decarboxylase